MRVTRTEPVTVRPGPGDRELPLFRHQAEAVERFRDTEEAALFFEMGCGKSVTLLRIAEAKYNKGEIDSLLVVAPNDVHRQWFDELVSGVDPDGTGAVYREVMCPVEAQCVGGRTGQPELYPFTEPDALHVVTVNVDTFSTPKKWEGLVSWARGCKCMLALDEATAIKNPLAKRSQRLLYSFNEVRRRGRYIVSSEKLPGTRHRAVLTGTPVTNGPTDVWAVMEFLRPGYFGMNYYTFRQYYCMFTRLTVGTPAGMTREVDVPLSEDTWRRIRGCRSYREASAALGCSEDTYLTVQRQDKYHGPYKHADELRERLGPVSVFRRLTECRDMPERIYRTRRVRMSPEQERAYNDMKRSCAAAAGGVEMTAASRLTVGVRLQQISSGFITGRKIQSPVWDDWDPDSWDWETDGRDLSPDEVVWLGDTCPRLEALAEDITQCDAPVLVLTRYSAEAARIYDMCRAAGYRTGLFTGWKIEGGIEAFRAGELDVLVANSYKISRGFNLQASHVTLFYSNTFSLETREQAEFRTFRMGQKRPCLYVDYSCSPMDETVIQALRSKKGLLEYIRGRNDDELF